MSPLCVLKMAHLFLIRSHPGLNAEASIFYLCCMPVPPALCISRAHLWENRGHIIMCLTLEIIGKHETAGGDRKPDLSFLKAGKGTTQGDFIFMYKSCIMSKEKTFQGLL